MLQILQVADLVRYRAEVVLAHVQILKVVERADGARQLRHLVRGRHEFGEFAQGAYLARQRLELVLFEVQSAQLPQVSDRGWYSLRKFKIY